MVCLNGKVALITGASSGIGAATAIHFASLGCSVAIIGRNVEKLKKTASNCIALDLPEKNVLTVVGDISDEIEVERIVQKVTLHFGRLDILVNNAAIAVIESLKSASLEDFDKIFSTNVRAVYHLSRLCVPHLKITKGNIVNVSSAVTRKILPNTHSYSATKSALDGLTRTMARELAKDGVRVNAVNPGIVLTDIFENSGISKEKVEQYLEEQRKIHALGRIADPMEIAKPIAFLASDDASFVTGTLFLIDGGYSLM